MNHHNMPKPLSVFVSVKSIYRSIYVIAARCANRISDSVRIAFIVSPP
jgi:hypothetical protein